MELAQKGGLVFLTRAGQPDQDRVEEGGRADQQVTVTKATRDNQEGKHRGKGGGSPILQVDSPWE